MPIQSILSQPVANDLKAAYRPILLTCVATATNDDPVPPVVYCDIYFADVFYKSLSKTQYSKKNEANSEWTFDIQDACQEYLRDFLAANGGADIVEPSQVLIKVSCKFRSSGLDAEGLIQPEGITPVQGTGGSSPVAGDGYASNTFYVVNATLQHEDNQDAKAHLSSFRVGVWNANCYPLTHRPTLKIGQSNSDYFPAIVSDDVCLAKLVLKYRYIGQELVRSDSVSIVQACAVTISSITVEQVGGTQNVNISWTATSGATGYVYRIDGGAWVSVGDTSVTVNSLAIGSHNVDVAAVCTCAQGVSLSQAFSVADPVAYTCSSVVSGITVSQTGAGAATVTFSSSGPATSWKYTVDGASPVTTGYTTFNIGSLAAGDHTIVITPVCDNSVEGTSGSADFSIQVMPSIILINNTGTGPGGIRMEEFEIGPAVEVGNRFQLMVYSHAVEVVAVAGDVASTIATKMIDAINATTDAEWNEFGSAPAAGTPGYPPFAESTGFRTFKVTLNWTNSFAYHAYLS